MVFWQKPSTIWWYGEYIRIVWIDEGEQSVQKLSNICHNLTKVIKSARFCAKICRNVALFNLNILLVWGVWVI
jgi:hypothetical protein